MVKKILKDHFHGFWQMHAESFPEVVRKNIKKYIFWVGGSFKREGVTVVVVNLQLYMLFSFEQPLFINSCNCAGFFGLFIISGWKIKKFLRFSRLFLF
ncbi:hypothetical protein [Paenibacillus andongensis]|uniref:hypothetical protein n=1 Tax=Paenibacillus andongensis TaxID=2975482 RepID=UPI0021BA9961|nr:hypothetical protein [Paenibacillus andongensis]